ncbi:unnamed protein product [Paramecium octaurelia]|uniref:Uncharacterized protein n=1 Tax=Paramecium octaurelia TaxID=43137 RepID=A0A8S1VPB9_PAROT|nr:unnamed protein product [Paramecium octaurelia]
MGNTLNYNQQNNYQSNCSSCLSKLICGTCKTNFNMYNGQCVAQCPHYSTFDGFVCKDITEQYPLATHILRAFYDNLIPNFIIENAKGINSFYQNQLETYYDGIRNFGGLKNNGNQYFYKQFNNLPPHYNLILQLNVRTFDFLKLKSSSNSVSIYIDNLLIQIEYIHTSNQLILAMMSVPQADTSFSFGISNINIMIQRCYPMCRSCIGHNETDVLNGQSNRILRIEIAIRALFLIWNNNKSVCWILSVVRNVQIRKHV